MKKAHIWGISVVALLVLCGGAFAGTIYVKADARGANNGSSWMNAYITLEPALQAAQSGDEVWVAAGIYYPTSAHGLGVSDRYKHFRLKNGVGLYGGFVGNESSKTQRNVSANLTHLSGDVGVAEDDSDNCYHVFYHPDLALDSTAILDGFVISHGNADGAGNHANGGGICNVSSSPTVRNCTFIQNACTSNGAAAFDYNSSVTFANCSFVDNYNAGIYGGAMYHYQSELTVSDCSFTNNATGVGGFGGAIDVQGATASITGGSFISNVSSGGGGAILSDGSSIVLANSEFFDNSGDYGAGICALTGSTCAIANCVFTGNISVSGGALYAGDSTVNFRNCILWGDQGGVADYEIAYDGTAPSYRYCDIQGCGGSGAGWNETLGTDSGGNMDVDPLFVDPDDGDFHLQEDSPCIDAGDGDYAPELDKDGNPRQDILSVPNTGAGDPDYTDIGAYEFQPLAPPAIVVTYPSAAGDDQEFGKTCYITWTSNLPPKTKVKIELLKGGDTWLLSAGASKSPFKWTVGKWKSATQAVYAKGDGYRIRISTLDGVETAQSAKTFSIGSVTSLTVDGETSITGGSAPEPYTCTVHYDFGSDRDVTSAVKWSCTKIKGLKMGKTGLLTTAPIPAQVDCTITAAYGKGKPPIMGTLDITISP